MISSIDDGFIAIKSEEWVIPAELIRTSGTSHFCPSSLDEKAFFQMEGEEMSACVPLMKVGRFSGVMFG